MLLRPDQMRTSTIPGSESMTSSYAKIMKDAGYDPQKEQEDAMRKNFDTFMQNARAGRAQGKGKYARVFPATAQGFQQYIAADAAYNLHQGIGGRSHDEQVAKGIAAYRAK